MGTTGELTGSRDPLYVTPFVDVDEWRDEPFEDATSSMAQLTVTTTFSFSEPGTYFPALRATVHREGEFQSPFARVQHLGRVRVVVE